MRNLWPAAVVMDEKAEESVEGGKNEKELGIMPWFQSRRWEGNADHLTVKAG